MQSMAVTQLKVQLGRSIVHFVDNKEAGIVSLITMIVILSLIIIDIFYSKCRLTVYIVHN